MSTSPRTACVTIILLIFHVTFHLIKLVDPSAPKKKKKSETRAVQYSPLNLNLFVYYYANMDIQILQVILQNLMYLDWHSLPPCSPLQSFTVYCQSGDHQCLLLLILHRWKHGVPWIWLSRHLYATTNLWDHYIVCIVKMEDMWSVVRVVGKSSGS